MLIISGISVNTIPMVIKAASSHFSFAVWFQMLRTIPLLWVTVIAVVQLTHKVARSLANRIIHPVDSFAAHMLASTLCSVFVVSLILTVVGTWIGTRQISLEPIVHFAEIWPRNFIIAFIIEMFIAQPVARLTMARIHQRMEMPSRIRFTPGSSNYAIPAPTTRAGSTMTQPGHGSR